MMNAITPKCQEPGESCCYCSTPNYFSYPSMPGPICCHCGTTQGSKHGPFRVAPQPLTPYFNPTWMPCTNPMPNTIRWTC